MNPRLRDAPRRRVPRLLRDEIRRRMLGMRILFAVLLTGLTLLGCSSPTPTATPTVTPTPTATPTPTPLERAMAWTDTIRDALASSETEELAALAEQAGEVAVEILCQIADGDFEPDLELSDLTDSRALRIGIRAYCATQ